MYRVESAVSTHYQKPLIMTVDSEYTAKCYVSMENQPLTMG